MSEPGRIRTVLGDVASEPWGITNAHAHLMGGADTSKPPFDTTDASELIMTLDDSLPELEDFARAGGFCLVDLTPASMGRDRPLWSEPPRRPECTSSWEPASITKPTTPIP